MPAAYLSVTETFMSNNSLVDSTASQTAERLAFLAARVAAIAQMRLSGNHLPFPFHKIVAMKMISVCAWSYATWNTAIRRTSQLVPIAALVHFVPIFTGQRASTFAAWGAAQSPARMLLSALVDGCIVCMKMVGVSTQLDTVIYAATASAAEFVRIVALVFVAMFAIEMTL